jgi:four helix bundle protein
MKTNPILQRLVSFSNTLHHRFESIRDSKHQQALIDQIGRSSSSAALNYSEAIVSASDKDYANKVRISLKEMNETCTTLLLLESRADGMIANIDDLKKEGDELVAILSACCRKAESKFRQHPKS